MAKLKFEPESKPKEEAPPLYESDESIFRRAKERIDEDALAVSPVYRVKNLQTAADLLSQIDGYPGARELREKCLVLLEAAQEEKKGQDYDLALIHVKEAKEEQEFHRAEEEFRRLPGFRDADRMAGECRARAAGINRRFQIRRAATIAVIVLAALFIFWCVKQRYMAYLGAKIEGIGGQYYSAFSRFSKLEGVFDAEGQAEKYYELYLRQREGEEKKDLPAAQTGDTVSFAGAEWLVLQRDGGVLLMIAADPADGSPYLNAANDTDQGYRDAAAGTLYEETEGGSAKTEPQSAPPETETDVRKAAETETDAREAAETDADAPAAAGAQDTDDTEDVTWETCSLRRYLNEDILQARFTALEQSAMESMAVVPSDNPKYGTKGGSETADKIRIPDIRDLERYPAITANLGTAAWLCTPGHDGSSACYVTQDGMVMLYGDDVRDTELSVCPVIRVSTDRLSED